MIYWLEYIIIDLLWNAFKIKGLKLRPNYFGQGCRRTLVGFIVMINDNPMFDPLGNPLSMLDSLPFVVFQFTSFYLIFDPLLSLLLGKPWNYKGKNSGYLDKLPMWAYYSLKGLCALGLVFATKILLN